MMTPEVLLSRIRDYDWPAMRDLAMSRDVLPEQLFLLAESGDPYVRCEVAMSPVAPAALVWDLAYLDEDLMVREVAAEVLESRL
jgi:hypothetical protein